MKESEQKALMRKFWGWHFENCFIAACTSGIIISVPTLTLIENDALGIMFFLKAFVVALVFIELVTSAFASWIVVKTNKQTYALDSPLLTYFGSWSLANIPHVLLWLLFVIANGPHLESIFTLIIVLGTISFIQGIFTTAIAKYRNRVPKEKEPKEFTKDYQND